jgi:hemolysin activation/secretion protein
MKLLQYMVLTALAGLMVLFHAGAWALPTATESEQRSQTEFRRQQEREAQTRDPLERTPDVRLDVPAAMPAADL